MSVSTVFLGLSVLGLLLSIGTFFRVRLAGALLVPTFLIGWLRGELALQTIAIELAVTALFLGQGVHHDPRGQLGLALTLVSWGLLVASHVRSVRAGAVLAEALAPIGIEPERDVSFLHGFPWPFRFGHPEVRSEIHVEYGPSLPGDKGGRNRLDLHLPAGARAGDRRPVLLQVHGGAWIMGDKREQGRPLMAHLAARGWVCAATNYRLSPAATMPDQIVDVKRALAWLRANVADYGGDPDFICITGGSAGGHLSSLAALTPNDPRFQPGFESVDTRVEACVPFYGVFDFLDRAGDRRFGKMADALGPMIFKCRPEDDPELWDAVCPIARVHDAAPPFFVIQGSHDSLVFAEEAVRFVGALRAASRSPVAFAELPGAQHAFEIFHSPRSAHAVRAATAFLEHVHAEYRHRVSRERSA
ncbi:MAG: alpha/beta hydrolase [Myxococcota bacterium]